MAASTSFSPLLLRLHSSPHGGNTSNHCLCFPAARRPSSVLLQFPSRGFSAVAFARRRKISSKTAKIEHSKDKQAIVHDDDDAGGIVEDELDEDAFEALFSQLEEDLKKDDLSDDGFDDEITEEDLAELEKELADALGEDDYDENLGVSPRNADNMEDVVEEEDEERRPKLKNWQVRRLARALKVGRRKTSIKNLAAELGLERAFVLELLRDPPPNILLMSASLPDEITQKPHELESEPVDSPPNTITGVAEKEAEVKVVESDVKVPVHVMQTRWFMQKRLKKVQVETLEKVYSRTKRPTNSMISSIVHVTNLPWKRVVKWFEDKRLEDGIPERRLPFRRSAQKTVSTG